VLFTKLNGVIHQNLICTRLDLTRGQGELAGPYRGQCVAERWYWWPIGGL